MTFLALNTTVILISIVAFLVVIMLLVVLLIFAKRKLTPQGEVTLTVNDDKDMNIQPGTTILDGLKENGINLPSACGGQGTCGTCRLQVREGGGSILPTEKDFFTRAEQNDDWRLGCQVKVKEDMKVEVPEEVFGIEEWECEVVSNKNVATFIKEFVVKLPEGETIDFKSGGYIQIEIPPINVDFSKDVEVDDEFKEDWEKFGLFNLQMKNSEPVTRAYSMANHPAENNIIMLNVRIATPPFDRVKGKFKDVNPGIASSYIFGLKAGDKVKISGPYGEFFLKDTDREMIFVGGGAGMAPMRSHLFHLFKTVKTNRKVSFWYGARSKKEMFYQDEFEEIEQNFENFDFQVALSEPLPEDDWGGPTGFIHQVLYDKYLSKVDEPEEIEYYLCGPPMMNDAMQKMLYDLGVPQEMIAYDDFGG